MKKFIEELASYKLWYLLSSELPQLSIKAIEEWYESESLYILAWLNLSESPFEIEDYFKKSLLELNINLPTIKESFNILLSYYLKWIDNSDINFEEWMKFIYFNLMLPFCDEIWKSTKTAYEECWLSVLWLTYVHYTDVDDDIEGWYYYKEWVKPDDLKKSYKKQIYDEIKVCINKLEKWILN